MWRAARWLAVGVTGAVGIVLGLTAAALGTEHGRDVVVAAAVSAARISCRAAGEKSVPLRISSRISASAI